MPTFNPDFGRQVWHRNTSASSLWSTQQEALLHRPPVRLVSELETTRSENIFQRKSKDKAMCFIEGELHETVEAAPLENHTASPPGKTLPWKRWSPWANQRPPTAAHDTFCNTGMQIAKLTWCCATLSSHKTVSLALAPEPVWETPPGKMNQKNLSM